MGLRGAVFRDDGLERARATLCELLRSGHTYAATLDDGGRVTAVHPLKTAHVQTHETETEDGGA